MTKFLRDVRAAEFSEVALIMAVVVLVAIAAYQALGSRIQEVVQNVVSNL